jgi:hypothetical protein
MRSKILLVSVCVMTSYGGCYAGTNLVAFKPGPTIAGPHTPGHPDMPDLRPDMRPDMRTESQKQSYAMQ